MSSLDTRQDHQHTSGDKTLYDDPPSDKPPSPQVSATQIGHMPQSDSGICLTPQSQGSVLSPQQTQTVHQSDDVREDRSPVPLPQVDNSSNPTHNLQRSPSPASSPRLTDSMKHSHQFGNVTSSDSRSSPPDHSKAFQSPRLGKYSSSQSSDSLDFARKAKYLVLQFLHHSTNEPHLLHLSQNSLSTTSESEPRFRSRAHMLRQQWKNNRVQSSPTSPNPRTRARPLAKTKVSRSSPNLKDANFFKDVLPVQTGRVRRPQTPKVAKAKSGKRSPKLRRQVSPQANLIRSVSENTENSECGTYEYDSDADDELDASFDSNHQGSVTSIHLRSRLAHLHEQMHKNRMSTVLSESESVAGESLVNVAEECMADPLDDEVASSILSLDMISLEQQPVSPATQYARVNEYLVQMSETSAAAFQVDDTSVFDVTNTTLQNVDIEQDEVDSPPFHFRSHPDQAAIESGLPEVQQFDLPEDGAVSSGFEPSQSFCDHPDDADLGACGGVALDECDAGSGGGQGRRADRSKLRLDIPERQEDVPLHSEFMGWLDPEEAEELLAFVAEFEEGWCWFCQ